MSDRNESPWTKADAANDNGDDQEDNRGNRTQARTVICDLPFDPGIIEGEVELLARFFDLIMDDLEAANDNESSGEN